MQTRLGSTIFAIGWMPQFGICRFVRCRLADRPSGRTARRRPGAASPADVGNPNRSRFGTNTTLSLFGASIYVSGWYRNYQDGAEIRDRAESSEDHLRRYSEMRKLLGLMTFLMLASLPVMAQGTPTAEVGGGYTFRSYGSPPEEQPPSRLSMNGWNVTGNYNFNQWLSAAVDVDWTTNSFSGATTHISTAMIGPQIYPLGHHKLTPFVHGLAGAGRYYFNFDCGCFGPNFSNSFSEYAFAWA